MKVICTVVLFFFLSGSLFSQDIEFTKAEKEWIKEHPVINFGYEPKWEPYEIYDDGEYKGIVGDYVKILEEKIGIEMVPIPNITWDQAINGLKCGEINIVPCCGITPDRAKFLDFSDIYIEDPMVIVTRKDFKYIGGIEGLAGSALALPKSYYSTEMISKDYPSLSIIEKGSVYECLESISYGETDAFVGNLGVISYHINNSGFTNLKIAAPTDYKKNGIALAVTKDWTIFKDIANKVFNTISLKERDDIRNNWISIRYEHGVNWNQVWKWILIGLACTLVLFYLFYLWNKSLKTEINLRINKEKELLASVVLIKKQDSDKKILLQEIHHRVKNNLQIITSIMNLHSNVVKDVNSRRVLHDAVDRIKSIALIHDKLYNTENISDVNIEDYISSLANDVIENFSGNSDIDLKISSNKTYLQTNELVPLALILNELITNSLKYGLSKIGKGNIHIKFEQFEKTLEFRYFDNGEWFDNPESDLFGTSLIDIFTEQLEGSYVLNKNDEGTEYLFKFHEKQ